MIVSCESSTAGACPLPLALPPVSTCLMIDLPETDPISPPTTACLPIGSEERETSAEQAAGKRKRSDGAASPRKMAK